MTTKTEQDLLSFKVPRLTPEGTCSASHELEEKPYDLRAILKINDKEQEEIITEKIAKLHNLLNVTQEILKSDWIGIYQIATNADGEQVLAKLAYKGIPSRAEFPLNEEFAKTSNNSTVGLTGKALVIDSVKDFEGPYYTCDSAVNSEACLPIFNSDKTKVIGIVDAESFSENHFGKDNLKIVEDLCETLSEHLPIK